MLLGSSPPSAQLLLGYPVVNTQKLGSGNYYFFFKEKEICNIYNYKKKKQKKQNGKTQKLQTENDFLSSLCPVRSLIIEAISTTMGKFESNGKCPLVRLFLEQRVLRFESHIKYKRDIMVLLLFVIKNKRTGKKKLKK